MVLAQKGPPNEPILSRGHGKPIQANKRTSNGQASSLKSDKGNITRASTRKEWVKKKHQSKENGTSRFNLDPIAEHCHQTFRYAHTDSNDHHGLAYSIVSRIFALSLTKPVKKSQMPKDKRQVIRYSIYYLMVDDSRSWYIWRHNSLWKFQVQKRMTPIRESPMIDQWKVFGIQILEYYLEPRVIKLITHMSKQVFLKSTSYSLFLEHHEL